MLVELKDGLSGTPHDLNEAGEAEYYRKRDRLGVIMAQSFSLSEMPMATLQSLLDTLEIKGVDRREAMADLAATVALLRQVYRPQYARAETQS